MYVCIHLILVHIPRPFLKFRVHMRFNLEGEIDNKFVHKVYYDSDHHAVDQLLTYLHLHIGTVLKECFYSHTYMYVHCSMFWST